MPKPTHHDQDAYEAALDVEFFHVPVSMSFVSLAEAGLTLEQTGSLGAAAGRLVDTGMPVDQMIDTTTALAALLKRGLSAQQAADEILASETGRERRA